MEREVGDRVLVDPRQLVEAVEHGREEEPGQEQRRDEVLDVAVEGVQRGERERDPGDDAAKSAPSGIASQTVARASGSQKRLSTMTTASITANATRFVATTESGTSCRGKRTLRMRFAFSSRLRDDACSGSREEHPGGKRRRGGRASSRRCRPPSTRQSSEKTSR